MSYLLVNTDLIFPLLPPPRKGYIQALAEADYYVRNGGYSGVQHSKADTGGEFMAAYENDLVFLEPDNW